MTREDARKLPPDDPARKTKHTRFRAVFTPGHVVLHESAAGHQTVVGFEADYTIFRDLFTTHEADGVTITMRWSFDGERLRFTDIGGAPGDAVVWGSHPWVKVD